MNINIDNLFSIHSRALSVNSERIGVLSANLANADTPGFKARDVDFQAEMRSQGSGFAQAATHRRHIGAGTPNKVSYLYRVPDQPSADGNTVDTSRESSAIAEATIRYQATLTFLNSRIRGLRLAITGGQ